MAGRQEVLDSPQSRASDDGLGASAPAEVEGSGTAVEREVFELAQENENLRLAIDNRAVIEQAKGVLMLRYGPDQNAAFAVLRRWSQDSNIRVHTIAERLVAWAGGDKPLSADQPGFAEGLEETLAALFRSGPHARGVN